MELFVLMAVQMTVAAGFARFYMKQHGRLEALQARLDALERGARAQQFEPTPAELTSAAHEPVAAALEAIGAAYARGTGSGEPQPEPLERILQLAQAGCSSAGIARATGRGRGEVELLLQVYRSDRGGRRAEPILEEVSRA